MITTGEIVRMAAAAATGAAIASIGCYCYNPDKRAGKPAADSSLHNGSSMDFAAAEETGPARTRDVVHEAVSKKEAADSDLLAVSTISWQNPPAPVGDQQPVTLRVLQINDAYLLPPLANLCSAKKALSAHDGPNCKTIAVLAGDFVAPATLSQIDCGRGMIGEAQRIPLRYPSHKRSHAANTAFSKSKHSCTH